MQEKLARLGTALRGIAKSLPANYRERQRGLAEANDLIRQEMAAALEAAINAEAKLHPQETYEDKKALAKWVNAELRAFGLAIKNPDGGKPCFIMGNPGGKPGFGRFLFEYTDDSGKRHHPLTSVTLPHLELVPEDLTRASYVHRSERSR